MNTNARSLVDTAPPEGAFDEPENLLEFARDGEDPDPNSQPPSEEFEIRDIDDKAPRSILQSPIIGIDVGTTHICWSLPKTKNSQRVFSTLIPNVLMEKSGKTTFIGERARTMTGKAPQGSKVIWPMKGGNIELPKRIEDVLEFALKSAQRSVWKPGWREVVVAVREDTTPVNYTSIFRALLNTTHADSVWFVSQPMAAAIGAGANVEDTKVVANIDIGGGTSAAAVITSSGVVECDTIEVAGDSINALIQKYVLDKFGMHIDIIRAEEIKIAASMHQDDTKPLPLSGLMTGDRKAQKDLNISVGELKELFTSSTGPVKAIVDTFLRVAAKAGAAATGDLINGHVYLTGGGANLLGLHSYLTDHFPIQIVVPDHPRFAVINGIRIVMENRKLLKEVGRRVHHADLEKLEQLMTPRST